VEYKYQSPDPHLYKQLLACYERCLKNKRHVKKSRFHLHHEYLINWLAIDIENNTYFPGISSVFVVLNPKPREVVAAQLRDRIVHHFIYQYMESYWEKRFAPNSYACRPGKGPLKATNDLRAFVRKHRRGSSGRTLWYLNVDVASFFPSINKKILFRLIAKHLKNKRMLTLCKRTLFYNPVGRGNYRLTCPKELWQQVPRYKSLFYAPPNKGLPIGNLSSQFWANIYMNVFDQWVMREFKHRILYWQRYVDDCVFFSEDRKALARMPAVIDGFLREHLDLRLNPKKTLIQPLSKGLDHLGFFHRRGGAQIRRAVVRRAQLNIQDTMRAAASGDVGRLCAAIGSYMGHYRQGDGFRLRQDFKSILLSDEYWRQRIVVDAECRKASSKDVAVNEERLAELELALKGEFMTGFIPPPWEVGRPDRALDYQQSWRDIGDFVEQSTELCQQIHE